MYQNGQLDEVQSNQNLNSQHMLSRSQSRLQSSIQRIDSHIKSTLPFLQGKNDKKYIFMKIHNFFEDNKFQTVRQLRQLLVAEFEDKIEIKYFKQTKELLKDNYNDNQLHYIIVPKIHLDWASTFAKQERQENNNKVKIYVYGILKKKEYEEKIKARSKKKLDTIPDYIEYFYEEESDYPQKIVSIVELHLNARLRQEGKHVKTWALTNKYSGKKVKKRTLHFFYEQKMEAEFTGIYKSFKKKSKASWLQIYAYKNFEDVLKKIRQREVMQSKEIDIAKRATSKILLSQSNIEPTSMKSGLMDGMGSQLNSSVLGASIRAINKLDQNDLNIILIHGYHSQKEKFKSLVRAQKNNNWFLWQIDEGSSDVMTRLRDFLNAQAKTNESLENEQYQRMIHCKHLIIMAHTNDDTTTFMFQNQKNTLNHMQLIHYQDPQEFSLLLRQGVESLQNFTIAVVPGGFRSFAAQYARVINEFNAAYKNGESVQNFKFVSSAMGRHGSNIFVSSNLLGTQSNLTEVKMKYDQDLQKIMKERDRLFHPFEGLTGFYVHLLIQESIADQLDGLKAYIDQNRRITTSTYIDKQMLKIAITNKTIKDSVIVITNDYTLRDAQYVLEQFQKVYILNITDRLNPKPQKKVVASGPKSHIYELIRTIPTQTINFQQEFYDQTTNDQNYIRKNRYLPKDIDLKLGSIVTVRIPASLKDDESHKIETRLLKDFFGYIQIEYYNNPKQIRLLNKAEEMLSFIIWAYTSTQTKQRKEQLMKELDYLKQLAFHQDEQLRQEFIIYSDVPKDFKPLVEDERHNRFKFVSSRWERIEEYIVGHFKKTDFDTIPSDMTMIVFHDDNDRASNEMIQLVKNRRNPQKLNAANHIQFRIIEDIKKSLEEQSPQFKFYIIVNQNTKKISLQELQKTLSLYQERGYYIKVILIKDDYKKYERTSSFVRKTVGSYQQAGEWLCKTVVENVNYYYMVPHVLIDKNTMNYYYFLDKFSMITAKFTFAFFEDKEELKKIVSQKRQVNRSLTWIIVSQIRTLTQYSRALQKFQNFKNGNVKFIYQGNQGIAQTMRPKIIFKNESKKQIEKFLLNIYRRDKRVYFPSSVGTVGNVALLILNNSSGSPLAINEQQITKWQNILKARVQKPKNMAQLSWMIEGMPNFIIYIIVPYSNRQQIANLFDSKPNIKRIYYAPFIQYNFRELDEKKIVEQNTQIFRGTYPAEITDYLKILRFNIRKPEAHLQKTIKNQLIQLYFQEEYKLNNFQMLALTKANDSLIINKNGYKASNIMQLLKTTNNFNYLHIFVGDESSGKQIMQYNKKYNRDIKFIDMKTPEISIMRGESKNKNWMLQTNDQKELITYLFNLPENRYHKAVNHKGKFNIYVASDKANTYQYLVQLRKAEKRNNNIVVHVLRDLIQKFGDEKQPSFGLIHAQNQKIALQNVGKKQVYYIIVSDEQRPDKSYTSAGNKHFLTKKKEQFKYFIYQLPTTSDTQIESIQMPINDASKLLNNIRNFTSMPLPVSCVSLTFLPNFIPIPQQQTQLAYVQLLPGTLDNMPPNLSSIGFAKADLPPHLLGLDILQRIIDSLLDQVEARTIPLILDFPPSKEFKDIKNMPDKFNNILQPLSQIPKPAVKLLKQKLAILHPSTSEFTQIGEVLKGNLEPDQFAVTLIPFKTELDLEQYSKNNGQKLNGYDKIVVFLSNIYRKYDPILKIMKSKLGGRMQYFIFDDNFHLQNHQKLKIHLRPYRIKKYELPYKSQTLPKFFNHCAKILIQAPYHLLKKYQPLKAANVNVLGYGSEQETHRYLHSQNTFIVLVTSKQNYHHYKLHAKISPCCTLLVDTESELPEDELYLYRISTYSIYYGRNGQQYLQKILPSKPIAPLHQKNKNLFYSVGQQELVFVNDYDEYEKIFFKDWNELYNYIVIIFKGRSNWLIKNSPGKPEVIPLHPVAYLENKQYMKDFKNNYGDGGYLNEQNIMRKSKLVFHEYADLSEVYYADQKDLVKQLQKQEGPSVVLFHLSNMAKMSFLRAKYNRHKWIGLTDNGQRWIDPQGILLDVTDYRLKRKQDIFANMFNKDVFDAFNDMRYFYLSNKANLDKKRNIYFRTKEQLLQVFQTEPNLLMVVFVQAKDVNHVPAVILNQASDPNGRVKLILLDIDYVDHQNDLFVKFNQIDPVIKHINEVEQAGRIDFMVYHQNEGERTVQTLIQKKKLRGLDDRVYTNMQELQTIAIDIKGKYRKVYVVCFEDERQQIQNIFNKYSIKNKGIPDEGVQYHFIDRKSFIVPNSSRLQPYGSQLIVNTNVTATNNNQLLPAGNSKIDPSREKKVGVNVTVTKRIDLQPVNQVISHRQVITITQNEPSQIEQENEENQVYGLPNMDSNIKPDRRQEKMQSILSNKNFNLRIDDKLKNLFPVGKFFTNRATFFSNPDTISSNQNQGPEVIIATKVTNSLINLSRDPNKLVIAVGNDIPDRRSSPDLVIMGEDEIPGLIRKLEGSNVEDELNSLRNIDDYNKVRVVYDKDIDFESKRRLLAASDKNQKIYPIAYKNVNQLKNFLEEPDSLLLLMMKQVPAGLEDAVQKQHKTIVKKKKVRMILPKKSDSDINGLQTILEEEQVQQQGQNLNYLSDEQVDVYLKLFETYMDQRPKITKPDDWQGERYQDRFQGEAADMDNITRLNVHSNIDPDNLLQENQIDKIKQRLNGDFIVLVVDNTKRGQVDEAIKKFNVLVQGYTNSMNLQNDIRDRKDNVTIAVIDRNMLDKIPAIKKKYPHTAFILQSDNHDQGIEVYRPYLSGQIKKIADLDKIIAELYQQNERIRFNVESNRAASRFEMKRTSIVDLSNNQRFTVGLSNQKSKKAFLFFKDPQNNHVRTKLSELFTNISCIPYKSVNEFKRLIDTYNNYTSILIANGNDIPELEQFVGKKKELIYVIRFNPPPELRDNPKVKKLLSTYNKDDLQRFIMDEFQKISMILPYDDIGQKYKTTKNAEAKRYIQKYEPNTFGTTPRFARDFVPPKSKQSTYSRRYMKSASSKSRLSRLQTLSPKVPRNDDYYAG